MRALRTRDASVTSPLKPVSRKIRFRLIEGRARYTKKGGGFALLGSLDAHLPQHLVLDLYQIAGVEESIGLNQGARTRSGWRFSPPVCLRC